VTGRRSRGNLCAPNRGRLAREGQMDGRRRHCRPISSTLEGLPPATPEELAENRANCLGPLERVGSKRVSTNVIVRSARGLPSRRARPFGRLDKSCSRTPASRLSNLSSTVSTRPTGMTRSTFNLTGTLHRHSRPSRHILLRKTAADASSSASHAITHATSFGAAYSASQVGPNQSPHENRRRLELRRIQ